MDIDVSINGKALSVAVENPHRVDMTMVMSEIDDFSGAEGVDIVPCELDKLIPLMIRGVAGCEAGCPSDAMGVVRRGFGNFKLEYIEGGILTARQSLAGGEALEVKIFPDFD